MKLLNIKKIYYNKTNTVEALKGINLEFNENGIITILGPSGCGKTTLLNIMSGVDKDYEGTIVNVPNFDYLTQEFNLFEEMSVIENLRTVKNKQEEIDYYLTMFQMYDHQAKKVKLLSNGQKKRLQFIRALLHKPGLLLCDEPTAALDHDNAILLMEELKHLSKDVQIILVTHDIALAEKYSNRIVQMSQGVVVNDKIINQYEKASSGESIQKKTTKETFRFVLQDSIAKWKNSCMTLFLSTLSIVMLFSVFSFYTDVMKQYDYNEKFKRGENLIVSLPNRTIRLDVQRNMIDDKHEFDYFYGISEGIKAEDVQKVIDNHSEIIAVESYWSKQYYLAGSQPLFNSNQTLFKTFNAQGETEIFEFVNYPFYQPMYVYSSKFLEKEEEFSQKNALYSGKPEEEVGLQEHFYKNNILSCYDLVNDATLPILVGKVPQEKNEVIISKNLADKIMINEGYDSYEELVNQSFYIGLYGHKNYYAGKDYVLVENENCEYEFVDVSIVDLVEVKVSAISTVESDYSLMVFFNNGYANNITINYFVNDKEDLYFHYVRFLTEPNSNTEKIAENINDFFDMSDKRFVKFEGRGLENSYKYYKNPNNFGIYFVSITIIFMLLFVVKYAFEKKTLQKENAILKRYGYTISMVQIMRTLLFTIASIIFSVIISYIFCKYINQFARDYMYEMLMEFSMLRIVLMSFCLMLYVFVLEHLISKEK